MSDESTIISTDNMQTIVAVAFILAVLSLVLNFYNFRQVNVATAGLMGIDFAQIERSNSTNKKLSERLTALEAELGTVKSDLAAQKAAATMQAAAAPAADAETATP